MARTKINFCPQCGKPLIEKQAGNALRPACPDEQCGFVYWNNPTPVIAAIVERDEHIILVRSIGWPAGWYGLVTGFLEAGETPEAAVLREVEEELGLQAELGHFIGHYTFERMNQLILAYHVLAGPGQIRLDSSELEGYKMVPIEKIQPWPMATGIALRDWLRSRGYEREFLKM